MSKSCAANTMFTFLPASRMVPCTGNIARRVWEHKQGLVEGFTKKYGVHRLVYWEAFARSQEAIQREKRLKKWNRACKIHLIESTNPEWKDLYETVMYMA